MFCHKCGAQLPDGSTFCQKCGARLTSEDSTAAAASAPQQNPPETIPQPHSSPVGQEALPVQAALPKKKSKKKIFIIGGVILAVIIVIIAAMSSGGEIDYIATVKAHTPYMSQGMSYTYEEVFEKYLSNVVWMEEKNDKGADVIIDGIGTGTDMQISFTIAVTTDPDNPDMARMTPKSAMASGNKLSTEEEVSQIFYIMFSAYSEDVKDFATIRDAMIE